MILDDDRRLPVAFCFAVGIGRYGLLTSIDSAFQEVSGIEQKMEVQSIREGGENRFEHQLPNGVKQQPLVLKRGVAGPESPLISWCSQVMSGGLLESIVLKEVQVCLLNESREPVRLWWFHNAYPVKLAVDQLNSTRNEVAIENIELAYQYLERII